MSSSRAMQRLCGLMRKAVQDYEMIAPGDKVMVGVSGGKDSVALTIGLAELRKYIGFDFTVQAVTLDPQFGGRPMDYTVLQELFAQYDIPYEIRRTEIGPVVFDYRREKNPCALCAKLRRGALHTAAQELGCNKVALGHHLDDAVETFYMNLWREGRLVRHGERGDVHHVLQLRQHVVGFFQQLRVPKGDGSEFLHREVVVAQHLLEAGHVDVRDVAYHQDGLLHLAGVLDQIVHRFEGVVILLALLVDFHRFLK